MRLDVIARRFEEWNTFTGVRSLSEFVLMLKLGRKSLPW
jgi:hypothetical protein